MRRILLVLAALACAVTVWFVWAPVESPIQVSTSVTPTPPITAKPAASSAADSSATAIAKTPSENQDQNRLTVSDLEKYLSDTNRLKEAAEKVAAQFLANHGETAPNLLALLTATGDSKYLERALELFPNSPMVLLSALGTNKADTRREEWIERFKSADSKNPLPWIFEADASFRSEHPVEGIASLKEALKLPGFYTYLNERADGVRALALETGASETVALATAVFGHPMTHIEPMMDSSRSLQKWVENEIGSGNPQAAAEGVLLVRDLSRMMQSPEASRFMIGQLVGMSLERRALDLVEKLPTNPLDVTVQQRREELDAIRKEYNAAILTAQSISPELMKEYLLRLKVDGELPALRWAKSKDLKAPVLRDP